MIEVFVYYVTNVYAQDIKACKLLNSLSISIIKGGIFIDTWPVTGIIQMLSALLFSQYLFSQHSFSQGYAEKV